MGPKRGPDEETNVIREPKIQKIDSTTPTLVANPAGQQLSPETTDFSTPVRRKLASSNRTGQACDRCKIRKIRCDPRADGCSPCKQNNTPCKTTDRITGKAFIRGYTEHLERQNQHLHTEVAELKKQLRELGHEPRAVHGLPPVAWSAHAFGAEQNDWGYDQTQQGLSQPSSPGYAAAAGLANGSESTPLPQFKTCSLGDNYLGVSSAGSLLSHIKGTSLSVFGTEIDITDFVDSEEEYDKSAMSYRHWADVVFNVDPDSIEPVPFPPYEQLEEWAKTYLQFLNPYTMLLDQADFMHLIWRISHETDFAPSPAQIVMVHMMLALLKYQLHFRNRSAGPSDTLDESHRHYRYALSFFPNLLKSHTLEDLQALALICVHVRNFPKPGAAWFMSSTTFTLAVELGLHRSVSAWAQDAAKKDVRQVELRKRVFWTLHALTINLSGRLGRPMPIALSDIDVEFPEPMDDSIRAGGEEHGPHKCSFLVGIQIAKFSVISSKLFSKIYAVHPHRAYEQTVRALEDEMADWSRQSREIFKADGAGLQHEKYHVFASYLETWEYEFHLLLHHPAVCRSTDPDFISSNLDKCLQSSRQMLGACKELKKSQSVDIPWISTVVYIAAIFTTLFIKHQRRDRLTTAEYEELERDMAAWIDIISHCGQLIGAENKLTNGISDIIRRCLSIIKDYMRMKDSEAVRVAQAALVQAPQDPSPNSAAYGTEQPYQSFTSPQMQGGSKGKSAYMPSDTSQLPAQAGPYPPVTAPYAYNGGVPAAVPPYQQAPSLYGTQPYAVAGDPTTSAGHVHALTNAGQRPGQPLMYGNAAGLAANTGQHPHAAYPGNGAPATDWRQWTDAVVHHPRPQEFLNTASTLMALNSGREGSGGTITAPQPHIASAPGGHEGNPGMLETGGAENGSGVLLPQIPGAAAMWPANLYQMHGGNGHVGQ